MRHVTSILTLGRRSAFRPVEFGTLPTPVRLTTETTRRPPAAVPGWLFAHSPGLLAADATAGAE